MRLASLNRRVAGLAAAVAVAAAATVGAPVALSLADPAPPVPTPGVSPPGVSPPGVSPPGVTTPGVSTPMLSTANTDACPHRQVPPHAVDTSEVPLPGAPTPAALPVPTPAIGGSELSRCGVVTVVGAPPVPVGIDSSGWLVADLDTGQVLAAKDPHGRYRPASTIKLLLAQVVLRDLPLDLVVTGTAVDASAEGDAAGIGPGGRYTVRDLLHGLLLVSGNDCAHALAMALGGIDTALAKMNALAAELGAHDTRAASPSGLDAAGMSISPYDLALIFRAASRNPTLVSLMQVREVGFPGWPGHPGYPIYNENRLLSEQPGAIGGKTGYTDDARKTYVGGAVINGRRLVVVQLYGFSYTGDTYWDQLRALFAYGRALPTTGIGVLVEPGATATFGSTAAATTTPAAPQQNPAVASDSTPHATPNPESGASLQSRAIIAAVGAAVVIALVVAATRLNRRT